MGCRICHDWLIVVCACTAPTWPQKPQASSSVLQLTQSNHTRCWIQLQDCSFNLLQSLWHNRAQIPQSNQIRGACCTCSLHEQEDRWMANLNLLAGPMRKKKQTVAAVYHSIGPMCLHLEPPQTKAWIHDFDKNKSGKRHLTPAPMTR
jgi:hypothetical protein